MKTKKNIKQLKELLQPKDYKTDIKLYCKEAHFNGFLTIINKKEFENQNKSSNFDKKKRL